MPLDDTDQSNCFPTTAIGTRRSRTSARACSTASFSRSTGTSDGAFSPMTKATLERMASLTPSRIRSTTSRIRWASPYAVMELTTKPSG